MYSVLNAGSNSDADYMIWLDADTFTHSPVSHEFLNTLVDTDKHLTYLGRENTYSEAGFVIYNLKHKVMHHFSKHGVAYIPQMIYSNFHSGMIV